MKESHQYWCENCEMKFKAYERKCPECKSKSPDEVLIDEVDMSKLIPKKK